MKSHLTIPVLWIFLQACNPTNSMNSGNPTTSEYWISQFLAGIKGTNPIVFRENTGTLEWTILEGTTGASSRGKDLVLDPFQNVVVVGETDGAVFNGSAIGTQDLILAKYDPFGGRAWSFQLGASGALLTVVGIATDSFGNVYLAGFTNATFAGPLLSGQDLFVIKVSLDGTPIWSKQVGPTGGSYFLNPTDICVDNLGNSYVVGDTNGPFGGPVAIGGTMFVVRFDSSGNQSWATQLSVTGANTTASSVVCDPSSNSVFVTGFGGADYSTLTAPGIGGNDLFIFKYDSAGNRQFFKHVGQATLEILTGAIVLDLTGNIFVGASSNADFGSGNPGTTYAGTIFKFDQSGTQQWVQQFGVNNGSATTTVASLTTDLAGNVFSTGNTTGNLLTGSGPSLGNNDLFFTKHNGQGEQKWVRQVGNVGATILGNGILTDPEGALYGTGFSTATINGLSPKGVQDSFLVKYR
ncbi:SBBP repeat-containing protein [Leptospira sp. 201903070]|uniref:SBBP repeat-containing protein n=1 Tax=Leptospira ainlahdjerensis TaxID=2810033 RepID=A0ABS2UHD3_9LEPT|nr:SBBP repeat-containing protein [Leptospira ainlahdjerensis]MBM9579343.1 SBBP repeat-containing protein [Leptospira ainlahdjerensis]